MEKTTLIITRHGNTFRPGETPTRVGARTDLPLVEEHRGRSIGLYLKDRDLIPGAVYAAPLRRTMETARLAAEAMNLKTEVIPAADFTEIDYGPDENRTEEEVVLRLGGGDAAKGQAIVDAWNRRASVPDGWLVNPSQIVRAWHDFADHVLKNERGHTTLLVTSNGILRFAPTLTGDLGRFAREHDLKVSTGGLCIFENDGTGSLWTCAAWDVRPYKLYAKNADPPA
jgi:probable phosphoglycerate mutase